MSRKNVIIIIIDALRADRLGCYGSNKNLTPFIDKIAGSGIVFENCYSTFNATDPSFTTITTGLHPSSHGIKNHGDRITTEMLQEFEDNNCSDLPEILKKEGYFTIGLDWLGRWHEKGYDFYLGNDCFFNSIPTSKPITDHALSWLEKTKTPFFLFIHYMDVHTPYRSTEEIHKKMTPSKGELKIPDIFNKIGNESWKQYLINVAGMATTGEEMIAAYNAAILYVDQEIGRIVHMLKEKKVFEDTIIIITSDHGESLTEHGIFFDHHGLYDESLHVPLIIGNYIYPPKKIRGLVQHQDIVPTLLDLLNIPFDLSLFDGESLLPFITGNGEISRSIIVSEETYTEKKIALRSHKWKYITARSPEDAVCQYCGCIHGGVEELYDLTSDRSEKSNCISSHPEIVKTFRELLAEWEKMMKIRASRRKIRKKIAEIRLKII